MGEKNARRQEADRRTKGEGFSKGKLKKNEQEQKEKGISTYQTPSPSPECDHSYSTRMFTATAGSLEGLPLNNHRKTLTQRLSRTLTLTVSLTSPDFHSLALLFEFATLISTEENDHFTVSTVKQESPSKACLQWVTLKATARAECLLFLFACMDICSNRTSHRGILLGRKWHRQVLLPSFLSHVNKRHFPAVKALMGFL